MLPRLVRRFAFSLVVLAFGAFPAAAQTGTLQGNVADSTGAPLANASISVDGTLLRTSSGSAGGYELRGVPAGTTRPYHTVNS